MVRCCNVLRWGSPATISPADACPDIIYYTKDNETRETSRYTTSAAYIHANLG